MQKNILKPEKAFLVGAILRGFSQTEIENQLSELNLLASTSGFETIGITTKNRKIIDPVTFLGIGKIQQIKNQAAEMGCNLIIFNDDISPSQLKNIQRIIGNNIKVIDRTGLILEIFTQHACTKEAKTQVELAKLEYILPRLTHQWTHLERQMGGIGTRAGAGETQIEIDRRLIRNKIIKLKSELNKIESQRFTQNQGRQYAYRIALVGYTNAGKSTIMNVLTDSKVLVRNQLFATLDTTTRKLDIDTGVPVLISDTVGFIRNLPHNLIASFRSTLGEIKEVDMIIKVFDASAENIQDHIATVEHVLNEIEIPIKKSIFVMNKIDLIKNQDVFEGLKRKFSDAIFISSTKKIGINTFISKIKDIITSEYSHDIFHLTYKQTKFLNIIYSLTKVLNKYSDFNGICLEVEGRRESLDKIKQILDN